MVLTNPNDQYTCRKILDSNNLLQAGRQQQAYEIIQELLNSEQIYFELHQKLPGSSQLTSTQPTTNQSVTPISGGTPEPFTGRQPNVQMQGFERGPASGNPSDYTPTQHEGGSMHSISSNEVPIEQ